jgi:hypothetical protein
VYTTNNDMCGNPRTIPRVTTLLLSCATVSYQFLSIFPITFCFFFFCFVDFLTNLVELEEPGICQYQFSINTKYACPVPVLGTIFIPFST